MCLLATHSEEDAWRKHSVLQKKSGNCPHGEVSCHVAGLIGLGDRLDTGLGKWVKLDVAPEGPASSESTGPSCLELAVLGGDSRTY